MTACLATTACAKLLQRRRRWWEKRRGRRPITSGMNLRVRYQECPSHQECPHDLLDMEVRSDYGTVVLEAKEDPNCCDRLSGSIRIH